MSSIKRDVKKKPRLDGVEILLDIQPTLFCFSEDVWLVVHPRKVPVGHDDRVLFLGLLRTNVQTRNILQIDSGCVRSGSRIAR